MATPLGSVARFILALAALLLCCGLFARADTGPGAPAETKIALVIGNSAYARKGWELDTAARDANDISATLEKIGFKVITRTDLGVIEFREALDEFSHEAEHADIALFYFAGHGIQYKGQNYFLPVDAKPRDNRDMSFQSIKMREVEEAISYAPKTKIIMLDACRNSVADSAKVKSRSATGFGDGDGLAQTDSSPNMMIFYSAQHGTTALDKGSKGVNSPFAQSLRNRLPEQSRELTDVFKEVSGDVKADTNEQQIPETVASLTESVYLNPAETASEVWKRIKTSKDPQILKDFIKQFPDSDAADAAQANLDRLDAEKRLADEKKLQEDDAAKLAAIASEKEAIQRKLDAERAAASEQKRAEKERIEKEASEKAELERQARVEAERQALDEAKAEDLRKANATAAQSARFDREKAAEEKAAKDAAAKRAADEAAAKKKAADDADAAHREEALLAAEATAREADRKALEAAEAAEAVKKLEAEKQQAKLEEEARKKQETEAADKAMADACAHDRDELAKLEDSRNIVAMKTLASTSVCRATTAAIAYAIKRVSDAEAARCAVDQQALAAVDQTNPDAIKAIAGNLKCDKVVQAASTQVAKLEEAALRQQQLCVDERAKLVTIDVYARKGRDDLTAFRAAAKCPALPAEIDAAVKALNERVAKAQLELANLGCFTAKPTGIFDAATATALTAYLQARKSTVDTPRITDGLLSELHDQDFKACAPPAPQPVAVSPARPTPGAIAVTPVAPVAPRQRISIIRPVVAEHPRAKTPIIDEAAAPRPRPQRPALAPQQEKGSGALPNIQINAF